MILDFSLRVFGFIKPFFGATGDICDPSTANNAGGVVNSFFDFPSWWKYLGGLEDANGKCVPTADFTTQGLEPIWAIGLAIIDIVLRIAGIMAFGYIVFAGYVYIRSAGNPEKIAAAQDKITNAIVGLIIILIATAVVVFIGGQL